MYINPILINVGRDFRCKTIQFIISLPFQCTNNSPRLFPSPKKYLPRFCVRGGSRGWTLIYFPIKVCALFGRRRHVEGGARLSFQGSCAVCLRSYWEFIFPRGSSGIRTSPIINKTVFYKDSDNSINSGWKSNMRIIYNEPLKFNIAISLRKKNEFFDPLRLCVDWISLVKIIFFALPNSILFTA
jgi:hypothetical protein